MRYSNNVNCNKVVIKFKNNNMEKGQTYNWGPNKTSFFLQTLEGESVNIKTEDLKAIFFVKDHDGNKNYKETYTDYMPGEGVKICTKFSDGESITGYSQGYASSRPGFIITPADRQSNNTRIFIVQSATEDVERIFI